MIRVRLNGEDRELEAMQPLSVALEQWGFCAESFAVAINETFVPRSGYHTTQIQTGDTIEVVSPLQGG